MRVAPAVVIDDSQKETLTQWARSRTLSARQVERARVVLLAAEGKDGLGDCRQPAHQQQEGCAVAQALLEGGICGLGERRFPTGPETRHCYREKTGVDSQDDRVIAGQRNPLEHAHHGCRNGRQRSHGTADLARQRPKAAPVGDL